MTQHAREGRESWPLVWLGILRFEVPIEAPTNCCNQYEHLQNGVMILQKKKNHIDFI